MMSPMRGLAVLLLTLTLSYGCGRYPMLVVVLPPTVLPPGPEPDGYGIVHAAPRYRDGRRVGVLVGGILPGSLAELMALHPGDVVVALAGIECEDLISCRQGALEMERALALHQPFDLVVERDGVRVILHYRYHRFRPLAM